MNIVTKELLIARTSQSEIAVIINLIYIIKIYVRTKSLPFTAAVSILIFIKGYLNVIMAQIAKAVVSKGMDVGSFSIDQLNKLAAKISKTALKKNRKINPRKARNVSKALKTTYSYFLDKYAILSFVDIKIFSYLFLKVVSLLIGNRLSRVLDTVFSEKTAWALSKIIADNAEKMFKKH